jgi:hypothetical protein
MLARMPHLPALPLLFPDPILEILDAVAADAKLDEVQGHNALAVQCVEKL